MPRLARAKNASAAPVDRIERWAIDRIKPYAKNPRLHSPRQIKKLAASLREFDQTQPVLVDEDGVIIAGQGRWTAAKQLNWTTLAVAIAVGWSESKKKANRLADNQLALESSWDELQIKADMIELKMDRYDLDLTGFDFELQRKYLGKDDDEMAPAPITDKFQILIECVDEGEQKRILGQLQKTGIRCRALIA